jgi:hypothetical protein
LEALDEQGNIATSRHEGQVFYHTRDLKSQRPLSSTPAKQ